MCGSAYAQIFCLSPTWKVTQKAAIFGGRLVSNAKSDQRQTAADPAVRGKSESNQIFCQTGSQPLPTGP